MDKFEGYLGGQFLIAMPQLEDSNFQRSLVYLCAHAEEGAMGLIVNRRFRGLTFADLIGQLGIQPDGPVPDIPLYYGGPVESGRGFVLHSTDYMHETSMRVTEHVALTATVDVLKAILQGLGPAHFLIALGYAGWSEGQLDNEILENSWLNVRADEQILFSKDLDQKYQLAMGKLGVFAGALSGQVGHA